MGAKSSHIRGLVDWWLFEELPHPCYLRIEIHKSHHRWALLQRLKKGKMAFHPSLRLGTPKDFWPIAVSALLSTVSVAGIAVHQMRVDADQGDVNVGECGGHLDEDTATFHPDFPAPTFSSFFSAFGATMYAFGGISLLPTIQG